MKGISVAPLQDRIRAGSIPEPMSGCWLWIGHIKANGYGTLGVKVDGGWRTSHAHRVAYEAFVAEVPDGLDLDHRCRTRCCVNPDHLEPVARSINLRRSPLMSRQSSKTTCPKGHHYSGTNSRGTRVCRICAAEASRNHYRRNR